MELLLFISAPIAISAFGFLLQFLKSCIVELVCLWEKKHCKKEDRWAYEIWHGKHTK